MIKVTRSGVTDGEVELIVSAARFFLDRLLTTSQQKKLTMDIDVTDKPGRTPIAIKWLVGSSGFFGWKPPHQFFMTVSVAAGVRDGLEVAANEIVHVAQTLSSRLKIYIKNREVNGKREEAYAASWVNGKFAFVDMTPRDNRAWEIEAQQLKTQLVDEFLAWSAGRIKKLPTKKPKKNGYGLYAVRPQITATSVSVPPRPAPAVGEIHELNDIVDSSVDKPNFLADTTGVDEVEDNQPAPEALSSVSKFEPLDTASPNKTTPPEMIKLSSGQHSLGQQVQDQHVQVNHLKIDTDDFRIAVNVPRLNMDRVLDGAVLHRKLNDLLDRGLIPHNVARTAFWQAQRSRIDR